MRGAGAVAHGAGAYRGGAGEVRGTRTAACGRAPRRPPPSNGVRSWTPMLQCGCQPTSARRSGCKPREQRPEGSWSGSKQRGVKMEPAAGKPSGTVKSKKPPCGANEGERRSRQYGRKPYGSRQSESRGAVVSGSPMTTAPSRRKSGYKAAEVVDEREEERSDSCHPYGVLARPKRAPSDD